MNQTDELNRLYRLKDVEQFAGLKRSQISELVKAGEFPRPIQLSNGGRAVAWIERELIEWQSSRIAARRAPAEQKTTYAAKQGL